MNFCCINAISKRIIIDYRRNLNYNAPYYKCYLISLILISLTSHPVAHNINFKGLLRVRKKKLIRQGITKSFSWYIYSCPLFFFSPPSKQCASCKIKMASSVFILAATDFSGGDCWWWLQRRYCHRWSVFPWLSAIWRWNNNDWIVWSWIYGCTFHDFKVKYWVCNYVC